MLKKSLLSISYVRGVQLTILGLSLLTNFLYYSHYQKVMGNTASRLLLALGPILDIGRPYTDLWERLPPGFLVVVDPWARVFGWSISSWRALQSLTILSVGLLLMMVFKKIFERPVVEGIFFVSLCLLLFSPLIQTDILSIELMGLVFALAGLTTLLYVKNFWRQSAVAAFCFFMASQMKETCTFAILAMLPLYIVSLRQKKLSEWLGGVFSGLSGMLVAASVMALYLWAVGGVEGYIQVLQDKFSLVRQYGTWQEVLMNFRTLELTISRNFLHWPSFLELLVILTVIIVLAAVVQIKVKQRALRHWNLNLDILLPQKISWEPLAIILFSLGMFAGMVMYGEYSVDVRQVPVIAAYFLLLAVFFKVPMHFLEQQLKSRLGATFTPILIACLCLTLVFPQLHVVKSFFSQIKAHTQVALFNDETARAKFRRTSSLAINQHIAELTTTNDCVLNLYGWEVAETYIYSGRRPCVRVFLANLLSQNAWQKEEYIQQVLSHPPKVIFYNTLVETTDLNALDFERRVIDFSQAIEYCYVPDPEYTNYPYPIGDFVPLITLYVQRPDMSDAQLQACFSQYGKAKIT